MERFRFGIQQKNSGGIWCCNAWQLLAVSFIAFACSVETAIYCGSVPGVVQTQHKLRSLRNNSEIVLISSMLFTAVADGSGDTPNYPQLP